MPNLSNQITQILPINGKTIKLAGRLLREGESVAFPTDTVYGLGTNVFEPVAVQKIFTIKQRPADKALPVFIAQLDDLSLVARHVPNIAWPLLREFWPGALTVVLPKNSKLPIEVTVGQETVAVRIPNHSVCLELVMLAGHPLAVTSANLSGQPTPLTAQEVATQLSGRLPLILDGGPSPDQQPSTIIDLSVTPPRLLRLGKVSLESLKEFLPNLVVPSL